MRRLTVEDFTIGTLRSNEINTNIPFTENYAKADTIQRANAVIAAYVNANYNELQNYNEAVEEIREEVEGFSETKQDTLTAGDNITITDENVISSVNTTYTAGTGIEITEGNVINNTQTSAAWGNITGTLSDQTDLNNALNDKQDVLTAGTNINIDSDNIISAVDTTYSAGAGININASNEISCSVTPPTIETAHTTGNDNAYAVNYINNITDYSSNETVVGKWINGETIYRKVLDFGAVNANQTKTVVHGISNLGTVLNIYGGMNDNDTGRSLNTGSITTFIHRTNGDAYIINGNQAYTQVYMIVEYLKSS